VTLSAIHFTDPGCPWAYSASPALAVLRWRFGDAIEWRLATIGLTESGEQYERRGYTPARSADRRAAEEALIELAAGGGRTRVPLGDDALWVAA
jgi:protein-disulfide isomerase-like protein with CxxC motif